eukprot:9725174-Karenia_brevis.AAC.1
MCIRDSESKDHQRRAYNLPVTGMLKLHADQVSGAAAGTYHDDIRFLAHRSVPCRLPSKCSDKERVAMVDCRLPSYMRSTWRA